MELYRGVISHKRWSTPSAPASHGFAYEIFLALIDISSPESTAASVRGLWPFSAYNSSAFASLHDSDHLKNFRAPGQPLGDAVRALIASRVPGWRAPAGARILLLTHLRTFGYCFNPISLYYVVDAHGACDTIIAEVSNTPWNEMHAYVLHARAPGVSASIDRAVDYAPPRVAAALDAQAPPLPLSLRAQDELRARGAVEPLDFDALNACFVPGAPVGGGGRGRGGRGRGRAGSAPRDGVAAATSPRGLRLTRPKSPAARSASTPLLAATGAQLLRFVWAKEFHVSPFFGLDMMYDWRFSVPPPPGDDGTTILVQSRNLQGSEVVFSTQLVLERSRATRSRLAYFLCVAFPLLTLRIQVWIHVEAMRLFFKNVAIFPHPTGAQNTFTRTVETIVFVFIMPFVNFFTACRRACAKKLGK